MIPSRRGWSTGALARAFLLLALSTTPTAAQSPERAARGFAEAWASGETTALRGWFAEDVRLTLDGRARTGVRPEQAVAALMPLRDRFEGPPPTVARAESMGPGGGSGFAELRWEARYRDSGTPRMHTFLLTFERVGDRLLVSDLRIVA